MKSLFFVFLVLVFNTAALAHDNCDADSVQNCVEGHTCAELKNGTCYVWNSTKACGNYCASGKTCGYSKNNTCFVWNTDVACGRHSCTVQRTCGALSNGTCFFYNESVSCN